MPIVGVISDTHGLLRPQAVVALRGVDHIIHAGDIGAPEILDALRSIAPLTAVRGNNDRDAWAGSLQETAQIEIGGKRIYALHDLSGLDIEPVRRRIAVVISGHSHKPRIEDRDGVLFVNPGSAGPRRFNLPVSVAMLSITSRAALRARIVELPLPPK